MGTMLYKTQQNTRKGGNNMWYGRALHPTIIDLEAVAERIQLNCSMKKSDVVAVISELVEVIRDEISNSNKVHIDGLGYFYNSLRTKGALTEEAFNATENIADVYTKFLAESKKTKTGRTRATVDTSLKFKKMSNN